MKKKKQRTVRLPNVFEALLPIVVMLGLMLYHFMAGTSYGDAHMPAACLHCCSLYYRLYLRPLFSDMMAGMLDCLNRTMEAILILCTVGILVASFIMSGTIPALIYYGLDLLTPKLFLPVGRILCAVVSLACGSSWTTTATIGIAFL